MAKKLLWIAIGLAAVAIACVVVVWSLPKPPPRRTAVPLDTQTAQDLAQEFPGDPDAAIGIQEIYSIRWDDWDREQQRYNFRFRAREFEPLSGNRGRFVNPVYVLYRYGETRTVVTQARADELVGTYEREGASAGRVRPIEGEMTGNVHIVIDRGDPTKGKADDVHVRLEDLQFRDRMHQFASRGPVRIESQEMDLTGHGLLALRSESDAQFESLQILRGERMVVRQGLSRFGITGEGGQATTVTTAATAGGPAGAPVATGTPQEGVRPRPAAPPATPAPAPAGGTAGGAGPPARGTAQPYRCIFYGPNIKAVMGTRTLTCDKQMTADFVMQDEPAAPRQAASRPAGDGQRPASRPAAAPASSPASGPASAPAAAQQAPETVITWEGPMHLMPVGRPQEAGPVEQFKLVAVGERVAVQEQEAIAVGQKFTYNNLTDAGILEAAEGKKVETTWADNLKLAGDAVHFDMSTGKAVVEGAGRLTAPMDANAPAGPENTITVDWGGRIRLTSYTYRGVDRHGQPTEKMAFEAAEFEKAVVFRMPDGTQLTGDHATVKFFKPEEMPPRPATRPAEPGASALPPMAFKSVLVRDGARMVYGSQDLTAEQIEIVMGLDETGRSNPKQLIATGHVESREDYRVTKADRLEADVTTAMVELPPEFRNGQPIQRWKRDMVIGDVRGFGHVDSFDTHEGYRVLGDSLVRSGHDREVRIEGRPARVFTPTNLIQAEVVLLDQATRGVSVPQAGDMLLLSDRDLQGTLTPTRYRVQWAKNMEYNTATDLALFVGDVTVLTRSDVSEDRVDCGRLSLKMAPRSAAASRPASGPATEPAAEGPTTASAPAGGEPPTQLAALGLGGGQMGRLDRVDARERVVVILDDLDSLGLPVQRTRISGEQLVLDGPAQVVRVASGGSLYWYGRGDGTFRAAADGAAPAAGSSDGQPTRIVSTWRDGMVYHMKTRRADIDGEANVVILGQQAMAANVGFGAGPGSGKTSLQSDSMVLTFKAADGTPGAASVLPQMGAGGGLKHVLATGRVHGEYGDLTIAGSRLDFDAIGGGMLIEGDAASDAQVYRIAPNGQIYDRFTGPRLSMNTNTGELDAAHSRLRYHPGTSAAAGNALP